MRKGHLSSVCTDPTLDKLQGSSWRSAVRSTFLGAFTASWIQPVEVLPMRDILSDAAYVSSAKIA